VENIELNYLNDLLVELDENEQFEVDGGAHFMVFTVLMAEPPPTGC